MHPIDPNHLARVHIAPRPLQLRLLHRGLLSRPLILLCPHPRQHSRCLGSVLAAHTDLVAVAVE